MGGGVREGGWLREREWGGGEERERRGGTTQGKKLFVFCSTTKKVR